MTNYEENDSSFVSRRCLMDFGYEPEEARVGCFGLKRKCERAKLPCVRSSTEIVSGDMKYTSGGFPVERPLPLKWDFDPGTPTCDFFEEQKLDDSRDLQDAVENFISGMERGVFLAWEAVVAREQGLSLTRQQHAALDELIDLSHSQSERVLYINGLPRTSEPWYGILNRFAVRFVAEPFKTSDPPPIERKAEWRRIVECLDECATGLSLPAGVASAVEVVPLRLRHTLRLQNCFEFLRGLGIEKRPILPNERQEYLIEGFVESLREQRDTVCYFGLTLDSLLTRLILPQSAMPIFIQAVQEKLGMNSTTDQIADFL
jgi:hypothetical protein